MTEPREFLIDMTVPAEERWQDVIASSRRSALKLARWVLTALDRIPLSHVIRGAVVASHRQNGSIHDDDLSAWAAGLGMPHRDLIAVNAAFELCQLNESKITSPSLLFEDPDLGVVHARNVDFEMKEIGEATVVYHFVGGPLEFMAVSLPGLTGVLSGMAPGRFSVSMANATPQGRPTLDFCPQMLIRHVLETAKDYDAAVALLSDTPLRSPVLFTVAGVKPGQGCIIERTRKDAAVRPYGGGVLVAANHYVSSALNQHNTSPALIDLSQALMRATARAAAPLALEELGDVFEVLNADGVVSDLTCQQVAFAPRDGLYCAMGRTP